MTQRGIVLLVVAASLTDGVGGFQTNVETIVSEFHPQALDVLSVESRGEIKREQCFAVIDQDSSGPLTILAAYTNLTTARVRLLSRNGSSFAVVAEPLEERFAGWTCEVHPVRLDSEVRKGAHVKLYGNRGSSDWVFAWDGSTLTNITPLATGPLGFIESQLLNAEVVDVNGDGVSEIYSFSQPPDSGASEPAYIYRIVDGNYALDRPVIGLYEFQRKSGNPNTDTIAVDLPTGAGGPFLLRVYNGAGGDQGGARVENAVESGRVWFNGQEIVSPQHFGNDVALIERNVTLQAENELKVRLGGAPGGRVVVVIDAASWTP
jgi:hypothetical protein